MATQAARAGERLGPYELLTPIGAGGMGEVWKARDTRLDRTVAIKFSHAQLTERFEREAKAIAALNHPNIAQIYDVGENYIVMEYVEGESVRPADDVRKVLDGAVQIADGLAAAHAAGFVHRDLKPDNILITKSGRVKILDFGLAKHAPAARAGEATRTMAVTDPGTIVGTVAYMSPEQARAQELDARSDQFSFGLILYELVRGKHAFQRPTSPETLTAIIREEHDPLPSSVPMPLRWIIERLLTKDAAGRYESTRDLYHELRTVRERLSEALHAGAAVALAVHSHRNWMWLLAIPIVFTLVAAALTVVRLWQPSEDANARLSITPFAVGNERESNPKFSPDGKSIVFERVVTEGISRLFIRNLDTGEETLLTEGYFPTWSPDGGTVFLLSRDAKLWSISASGGSPRQILGVRRFPVLPALSPDGKQIATMMWDRKSGQIRFVLTPLDGSPERTLATVPGSQLPSTAFLVFSPDGRQLLVGRQGQGLSSLLVSYPAGKVRELPLNNVLAADWLPDSRHIVFTSRLATTSTLSVGDVHSGAARVLFTSMDGLYRPSASPDGSRIALVTGKTVADLLETGLDGKMTRTLLATPLSEHSADWAPSGDAYVHVQSPFGTLWIRDRDNKNARQVTNQQYAANPKYSPDGRRVAYRWRGGVFAVLAGGGRPVVLKEPTSLALRTSIPGTVCWSPDGKWIAYSDGPTGGGSLWKIESSGGTKPVELVPSGVWMVEGTSCAWSADGETIAYNGVEGVSAVSANGANNRVLLPRIPGPMRFLKSGELLTAGREGEPAVLVLIRCDVNSGKRLATTRLELPQEYVFVTHLSVHPDGRTLAIAATAQSSDILMLENFARPATGWRRLFSHWMAPEVRP